ncbi:MAG TPA: VOC family protein [Nocardioidaceae bacterium]|nr:VOC family protein [Nocardioidaceae bacterium]
MSGRVVHFEIPYDDGDRARSFYSEAFGWDLQTWGGGDYTLVSTGPTGEQGATEPGFINGGMMQREAPYGSPVLVVEVDDVDAALEKIETLGGTTVTARQPVGDMGWSAYFKDPEGNLMGLFQVARS